MVSNYEKISISLPPETVEMLRSISRARFKRDDRVTSMTIDNLIREEYQRLRERDQEQTPTRG